MRRRAELQSVQHATEARFHFTSCVSGDGESLVHNLRQVVTDGPRRQLHPVADDVVLVGFDFQGVGGLQRLEPALRHGKGVMRELDGAAVLVLLIHGKIDHPAEAEDIFLQHIKVGTQTIADLPGEARCRLLGIAGEKHRIAVAEARHRFDVGQAFRIQVLGDRPLCGAVCREDDIAKPGRPLAPRPVVQLVEKASGP